MLRPVEELNEFRYSISDIAVMVKGSSDSYTIQAEHVKGLSILHKYDTNIIPLITLTAGVEKELYGLLSTSADKITMQVSIHKYINNSDIKAKELVFSKVFSILVESDMQHSELRAMYGDTDNTDGTINGASTQQLMDATIYLMDNTKLTNYKKVKSVSVNGTTIASTIAYMFSSRGFGSLLMSKIPGDAAQNIIIPAYNLLYSLSYLNAGYGIYNAEHIFYMDINENYLLDRSSPGKAVRAGKPTTVNMFLEEYASAESATVGSYKDNETIIVNITGSPIIDRNATHGEYIDGTNIVAVDADGNVFSNPGDDGAMQKMVQVYNNKVPKQLQYASKEARYRVGINLLDVDIDTIAPNLLYNINAHAKFQKLNPINGKYRIHEAHLIFLKTENSAFSLRASTLFIKIP
jgi:hypothetical protein